VARELRRTSSGRNEHRDRRGRGLKLGDTITVLVLGREVEARIAVLRKVDFGGFGPNFALIFNPATLEGAELRSVAIARLSRDP
jgi:putative ABC transport system permease protein